MLRSERGRGRFTNSTKFGYVTLPVQSGGSSVAVISAISSGTPGTTTATITWTTDINANSIVEYGLTVAYGSIISDPVFVSAHSIGLTGLTTGTTYHYRVKSVDAQNRSVYSADQTFITA